MSNLSKIKELENQKRDLVLQTLSEIDLTISVKDILEELQQIKDYLPKKPWVQHIFEDKYGPEIKKLIWKTDVIDKNDKFYLKEGYDKYWICCDEPYMEDSERHEDIDLIDGYIGAKIEECDNWETEKNELTTVLTNRGTEDVIQVTKEQACRDVIEWIVKNKCGGFNFDW
jgi:hypothetical protein